MSCDEMREKVIFTGMERAAKVPLQLSFFLSFSFPNYLSPFHFFHSLFYSCVMIEERKKIQRDTTTHKVWIVFRLKASTVRNTFEERKEKKQFCHPYNWFTIHLALVNQRYRKHCTMSTLSMYWLTQRGEDRKKERRREKGKKEKEKERERQERRRRSRKEEKFVSPSIPEEELVIVALLVFWSRFLEFHLPFCSLSLLSSFLPSYIQDSLLDWPGNSKTGSGRK